jgi:hypothetical protein
MKTPCRQAGVGAREQATCLALSHREIGQSAQMRGRLVIRESKWCLIVFRSVYENSAGPIDNIGARHGPAFCASNNDLT